MASVPPITGPISGPQAVQAVQPPVVADKAAKYRGAVIEDLQLPPAVCVPRDATVGAALSIAHDHDYSQLPLVGSNRKLLGYVDVASLRAHVEAGTKKQDDKVDSAMVRFKAMPGTLGSNTYTVIEPNTGLGELEAFLEQFPFAFVTDPSRAFVLGVATREDLSKFVSRRGLGSGAATPTQGAASSSQNGATSSQAPLFAASQPVANTNVADAPAAGRPQGFSTRREEEEARKDRSLAEFLLMLDGYQPLIPDQVTDYYLEKVGFECHDVRLKRLLSLAAEKFVSDIAADAFQYARIRTNAGPGGRPKAPAPSAPGASGAQGNAAAGSARDRSRTVLTMDDLSAALGEYGINARRAEYYR